jgi:hypothetical protein
VIAVSAVRRERSHHEPPNPRARCSSLLTQGSSSF